MFIKPTSLFLLLPAMFLCAFIVSCDKEDDPSLPVMMTIEVSNITKSGAHSGGFITSDGGANITERGVCWSTIPEPTTSLSTRTSDGNGIGSYTSVITGLSPGTTYFVRGYSTNKTGTVYGNELSFTTLPAVIPVLTTKAITNIITSSARSGGNITDDGGAEVTARGICWSENANPTIELSTKTVDGAGTGEFASDITALTPGKTYHVRAYATNSMGTGYGADVIFSALPNLPVLTTSVIGNITSSGAAGGGYISSDGGSFITARGVCWSTSPGPTVDGNKTTNGVGAAQFFSTITGLTAATKYYVRAYATNNGGTSYGNEVSFTTPGNLATLSTHAITNIADLTATSGGNIANNGGAEVTARGICWSQTANPTIANFKTTNGAGNGDFIGEMTGLYPSTVYYVRAYATNNGGTAYGNEVSFTTSAGPVLPSLTDIDGNTYAMVQIGTQKWMAESLRTTHYRDGSSIATGLTESQWQTTTSGAYAKNGNSAQEIKDYGSHYNWYAMTDSRKLCPAGSHLPTREEWRELVNYLGGMSEAAVKLRSTGTTYWNNSSGTNSSGFNAHGAGFRDAAGFYALVRSQALFGSTTSTDATQFYALGIKASTDEITEIPRLNATGTSVRCIGD